MERIGSQIESSLARTGAAPAVELQKITAAWPDAVGDAVARNAWPLRIGRDGVLHVATSSATWAFELDRLSPELQRRLSDALGGESAPTGLRFRVGPIPEPGRPAEEKGSGQGAPVEASPETLAEADFAAAEIEDPELRELVRRAARASLARAGSGRAF
jgi:hypothetical protein